MEISTSEAFFPSIATGKIKKYHTHRFHLHYNALGQPDCIVLYCTCSVLFYSALYVNMFRIFKIISLSLSLLSSLNYRAFQYVQTVLYALKEINNSTSLLPGVSLGYKIYDSCGSVAMGVRGAMALSNGVDHTASVGPCTESAQVVAIIGETSSSPCMAIATSIGPFRIPMVRKKYFES